MFLTAKDYLLPCLNKSLFGVECLGCGIQRAFLLLIHSEFLLAFKMYPAIYTLLLFVAFLIINYKIKLKNGKKIIIMLTIINVLIIVVSYFIKMKPLLSL